MSRQLPTSTYRLHLTDAFTLNDAAAMVDHLNDLGADWAYASPVQRFPEGATHGYHILDPDTVDPQLGGEDALRALSTGLAARGRGLLLDIVPNHLAASPENPWWEDLLRQGPDSPYASTFDVDLTVGFPLVLPVLDRPLEETLADGALRVRSGGSGQQARLDLGSGFTLPLAPGTDPTAPLEDVLAVQHYRLHHWEAGQRILNWRRFFAVNELVGVRVEDPEVFAATHRLIKRLVDEDIVQGLRVDHIDGLADPAGYLDQLRALVGEDLWVLVEKIVDGDEQLPQGWPIAGTTGYEVATLLGCWLTDVEGYARLQQDFATRTGIPASAEASLPGAKRAVLEEMFPGEIATVSRLLGDVTDATSEDVRAVLTDMAAHLHGYRTYVPESGPPSAEDLAVIGSAAGSAAAIHGAIVHDITEALLSEAGRPALLRWQQLTGPAAAKGFEDRLLYVNVALSSLCEVGMDAATLDSPPGPAQILDALADRQRRWPHAGATTSTHDTKRGEDVRGRIAVLAELPKAFSDLLDQLEAILVDTPIDPHAGWLLTQSLLGMLDLRTSDPTELAPRLVAYAEKALREAALATSYQQPDEAYEAGVHAWIHALTSHPVAQPRLRMLARQMEVAGVCNGLATVALKLGGPGVADVYRGTEVWDDSLVDPDNRRPLEVERIRALGRDLDARLSAAGSDPDRRRELFAELRSGWRDGAIKLHVTREGLRLRQRLPVPLLDDPVTAPEVHGPAAGHVAGIARGAPDAPSVLTVATRLPYGLSGTNWPLAGVWTSTQIRTGGTPMLDVLTGQRHEPDGGWTPLDRVLSLLPVAMLVPDA